MRFFQCVLFLSMVACNHGKHSGPTDFTFSGEVQRKAIDYLKNNVAKQNIKGDVFCSTNYLGADSNNVYLLFYCQEFYKSNDIWEAGTGEAGPIAIKYEKNEKGIYFTGYQKPRDGNLYAKDIEVIFPHWAQSKIKHQEIAIERLRNIVQDEVKKKVSEKE